MTDEEFENLFVILSLQFSDNNNVFVSLRRELFTRDENREKEQFDGQVREITVTCEKVPWEKEAPLHVYRVKVPGAMAEERRNRLVQIEKREDEA